MPQPMQSTKSAKQIAASWTGKVAHEIGLLTDFDGSRAYRNAKSLADYLANEGEDLALVDPIEYVNQIFGRSRELMRDAA